VESPRGTNCSGVGDEIAVSDRTASQAFRSTTSPEGSAGQAAVLPVRHHPRCLLGGVLFDVKGYQGAFVVSATVLFAAAVLALRTGREFAAESAATSHVPTDALSATQRAAWSLSRCGYRRCQP
jgi:hypothetical protein